MKRASYKGGYEDLDLLRGSFEEFRRQNMPRTRLPEELWIRAAEVAGRRGVNLTARCLRLDTNHLKNWMVRQATRSEGKPERKKRAAAETPARFLELLAPMSNGTSSCIVEVESPRGGKLRMEWKGVAAGEIAQLIQLFADQ